MVGLRGDVDVLTGPRDVDLVWDDLNLGSAASFITESVLSIQTEYNMDLATQVTVQVHDPDFVLARNHYFAIARTVWYRSFSHSGLEQPRDGGLVEGSRIWQRMEIASATMGQGSGLSAVWTIQLRPKGIQQLKRKKDNKGISGEGHNFIKNAAGWAGLYSVVQQVKGDTDSSWQAEGDDGHKESAWDVMSRVKGAASPKDEPYQFMMFEVDNVLFFGTQRWLLGQWGSQYKGGEETVFAALGQKRVGMNYIYMGWPASLNADGESQDTFRLLAMPQATRSDNNPLEVTGSIQVDRFNGRALRPGMTILLDMERNEFGTRYFNGYYLISSVSFEHYGTGPVSVTFRSPERLAKDMPSIAIGDHGDPRKNSSRRAAIASDDQIYY